MAARLVAVPDTDEELLILLGRLEEVLLALVQTSPTNTVSPALTPRLSGQCRTS